MVFVCGDAGSVQNRYRSTTCHREAVRSLRIPPKLFTVYFTRHTTDQEEKKSMGMKTLLMYKCVCI